jgi:hypothetical protein
VIDYDSRFSADSRLAAGIATASQTAAPPPSKTGNAFGVIETWFDLTTAQELIEWRKRFDAAELAGCFTPMKAQRMGAW